MPYWPEIISAVTRQNQAVPMPIAAPVTMLGPAPGRMISPRIVRFPAPRLRAEAIEPRITPSTPCTVLSRIGNRAPVNVMNIIDSSDDGNIRIARGIQATAGSAAGLLKGAAGGLSASR